MHPNTRHPIDCHILTLPRFDSQWVAEMRSDLDAQPVNQHWLAGVDGQLALARANGFEKGGAPFVSSADPDDRIMPGTFAALLQALQDHPEAPFAWAGEKMVNARLADWPVRPNVWACGYDPLLHVCRGTHVHGVKLYRRECVLPHLEAMRSVGQGCEFYLDLAIARPFAGVPRSAWPVHVPMVGRLWRQHNANGSRQFEVGDFEHVAQALGFDSMQALQEATRNAAV